MARILIVDDQTVLRVKLGRFLALYGHKIVGEGKDGKQAVSMYKKFKPDIVMMDITMPNMSGLEAVQEIIKIDPDAKIIMVSAMNQKSFVFKALQYGAKHYIVKPFDSIDVIRIVQEVLNESCCENISFKNSVSLHYRKGSVIE